MAKLRDVDRPMKTCGFVVLPSGSARLNMSDPHAYVGYKQSRPFWGDQDEFNLNHHLAESKRPHPDMFSMAVGSSRASSIW